MTMNTILFDLDGTLTDPAEGITNSVAYALKRWGIEVADHSLLNCFIGPPLAQSFTKYYGFSEEDSYRAVDVYREYFRDRGMFENVVYDGIPELLDALKRDGKRLIVATSKPTVFSETILRHFGLIDRFEDVVGSELDGRRTDKGEVIACAMQRAGATAGDCVMVGDREHDILGAHKCGVKAIGVLWGYGDRAEHEKAGADHIAADLEELRSLLMTEGNAHA